MKICVGMGTIDEYESYVKAGADEVFAGYIPHKWMMMGGEFYSLNRREVLNYNVQIGSRSELEILADMQRVYKVPVVFTFNSLLYGNIQYPLILEVMKECMDLGFYSFIIADIVLLMKLQELPQKYLACIKVHLSGECGELNGEVLKAMDSFPLSRIIFHRKNRITDMRTIMNLWKKENKTLEYEAFALNEMCHFNGAFCNTLHCDELIPVCRIPYQMEEGYAVCEKEQRNFLEEETDIGEDGYLPGKSGCAICSLWELKNAGITHLKVVSRGNYSDDTCMDIKTMKRALELCDQANSEETYIASIKQVIFPDFCSGNCYYPK